MPGELLNSAAALLAARRGVAVFTGFPCVVGHDIPTENDGLAGTVAIARAALLAGKRPVVLVTDKVNHGCVSACRDWLVSWGASQDYGWDDCISVVSFPSKVQGWNASESSRLSASLEECDHFVAIERAGRAVDGRFACDVVHLK